MIKHHQGAIDASDAGIAEGQYGLAMELAKKIKTAQAAEITKVQAPGPGALAQVLRPWPGPSAAHTLHAVVDGPGLTSEPARGDGRDDHGTRTGAPT